MLTEGLGEITRPAVLTANGNLKRVFHSMRSESLLNSQRPGRNQGQAEEGRRRHRSLPFDADSQAAILPDVGI